MHKLNRISLFCGSHYGGSPKYEQAVREVGKTLAERKIGIVYGGAKIGLMGVLAEAALAAGGEVIGVMPEKHRSALIAHRGLTELIFVETRHERKLTIAELSDGFIAMPGGLGVMEEFTEMAMLTQTGQQIKPMPCGLLNVNRYYDHLIAHFELGMKEEFIKYPGKNVIMWDADIDKLLTKMSQWS